MNIYRLRITVGFLTIIFLMFLLTHFFWPLQKERSLASVKEAIPEIVVTPKIFPQTNLEAKAAIVYQLKTGHPLFEKNADTRLSLASITKIMTTLLTMKKLPEENILEIDLPALSEEGDSGLRLGEHWSRNELVKFMLVNSSNDAARALALAVEASSARPFVSLMNESAKTLGLTNTYFLNPTGLDSSSSLAGSFGSARDVAHLFGYVITRYPEIFEATRLSAYNAISQEGYRHLTINTNPNSITIPGFIASKTGFTDLAGGNLVMAFDAGVGNPIVIVVLGSSHAGRFTDASALIHATLKYFE